MIFVHIAPRFWNIFILVHRVTCTTAGLTMRTHRDARPSTENSPPCITLFNTLQCSSQITIVARPVLPLVNARPGYTSLPSCLPIPSFIPIDGCDQMPRTCHSGKSALIDHCLSLEDLEALEYSEAARKACQVDLGVVALAADSLVCPISPGCSCQEPDSHPIYSATSVTAGISIPEWGRMSRIVACWTHAQVHLTRHCEPGQT